MAEQTISEEEGRRVVERLADNDNAKEKPQAPAMRPEDSYTIAVTGDNEGVVRVAFFRKSQPDTEVFYFTVHPKLLPGLVKRLLDVCLSSLQKPQAGVESPGVSSPDIKNP